MKIENIKFIGNTMKALYSACTDKEKYQLLHLMNKYDTIFHSYVSKIMTNNFEPQYDKNIKSYWDNGEIPNIGDIVYYQYNKEIQKGIIIDYIRLRLNNYACEIKNNYDKNFIISTKRIYKNTPKNEGTI